MHRLLQFGLLLLAAAYAQAETRFQRPPGPGPNRDYRDNPVYDLGEEVEMIWEKDFDEANIVIWQQDVDNVFGDKSFYAEVVQNTKSTRYTWKVSYDGFSPDHDPALSNVYFFMMSDVAGLETPVTSHYFNISKPLGAKTTSASASATATDTSSETAAGKTVTETASKATSTSAADEDTNSRDKGLSTGAVAGIAVGAAIGGLLVLGALGFIVWRLLRRGSAGSGVPGSPDSDKEIVTVASTPVAPYQQYQQQYGHQSYYQPVPQHQGQHPQGIGALHEAPA